MSKPGKGKLTGVPVKTKTEVAKFKRLASYKTNEKAEKLIKDPIKTMYGY